MNAKLAFYCQWMVKPAETITSNVEKVEFSVLFLDFGSKNAIVVIKEGIEQNQVFNCNVWKVLFLVTSQWSTIF